MRTVIEIDDDSDDGKLVPLSTSTKSTSTKVKDKPTVVSLTSETNGFKIKDEPDDDRPVVISATERPNKTHGVKIEGEDRPEVVSATNRPEKPRVKKEKVEPDEAPKNGSALAGFVDQNMFEDVDREDGESGDEIVDSKYVGLAHINGIQHFVCEGFKIRQVPEPVVVKRSLHDLNACILAKSIVLDPDYQRDVVWEEGRASMLITSILMGYFIPPIIFNVKKATQEDRHGNNHIKWMRICVDGKQRLTSVWKFMTGKIGFFDTSTPQRKWFFCYRQTDDGRTVEDPSRNILPQAVKDFFQKQYFCCYEYDALDLDTEETMFQLVQRGLALTSAEKMRAMSTQWANFTKEYEDEYEIILSLSKHSRASGFRLILTIFTMIQEIAPYVGVKHRKFNKATPILRASPAILGRVLEDETPIDEDLKSQYRAVFNRYDSLVKLCSEKVTRTRWRVLRHSVFDPNPPFLYRDETIKQTKTYSPVEFIVVALLLAVHKDRTDDELLSDIAAFRTYIRKDHKDLRVNAQCWTTSWTFISTEMDRRIKYPDLVVPAPEGMRSDKDPLKYKKKKKAFSRSTVKRLRSGSSSSLSEVPSELLDEFDDEDEEEEEEDIRPLLPSRHRQKRKRNEKESEKGKGKSKSKSRERDMDSEEMNGRGRKTSKRAKQTRTQTPEMDYSAEFPNLDI